MSKAENRGAVLVVDDETALADLYTAFLEPHYTVNRAYDGEAALAAMTDDVGVVLLDRRMPKLSGDDVLARLRESGNDCPVAMVSAVTPDLGVLELPFDLYLTKPVERKVLLRAVEFLFDLEGWEKRLQEYCRLRVKQRALELNVESSDLDASAAYASLLDRQTKLEASLPAERDPLGALDPLELVEDQTY